MGIQTLFKVEAEKNLFEHKCPLPNLFLVDNDFGYGTVIQCEQCHSVYRASRYHGLPYWDHLRGIKLWWYLKKLTRKRGEEEKSRKMTMTDFEQFDFTKCPNEQHCIRTNAECISDTYHGPTCCKCSSFLNRQNQSGEE